MSLRKGRPFCYCRSMIYLDWAATTPPDRSILEEVMNTSECCFANPSSLHSGGQQARKKLDGLRQKCASLLDCGPQELYFTSGGTESNNLLVSSLMKRREKGRIIISGLEHPSVWEPVQALRSSGWEIKTLNPGPDGRITEKKTGPPSD